MKKDKKRIFLAEHHSVSSSRINNACAKLLDTLINNESEAFKLGNESARREQTAAICAVYEFIFLLINGED